MAHTEAHQDLLGDHEFDEILDLVDNSGSNNDVCRGGSRPVRAANVDCDREAGAVRLNNDYFSSSPTYSDHLFERPYRVSPAVFLGICHKLEKHVPFF